MSFLSGSQCSDFVFFPKQALCKVIIKVSLEKKMDINALKKKKALKQKNGGEESSANMSGCYKSQWSQQYCRDPGMNRHRNQKKKKKSSSK